MKFAVNALIWTTDSGPQDFSLLPMIREHGFDGFEVPPFLPAKIAFPRLKWDVHQRASFLYGRDPFVPGHRPT